MELIKGLIVKGSGGLYEVLCDNTAEKISCRAKGVFRHEDICPTVGDRVTLKNDGKENYVIESIEERKNLLIRPSLANLDRLFIVIPAARPDPDLFTVDKLSAIAEHNCINTVMIISKCCLDMDKAIEIAAIYKKCGFRVFVIDSIADKGIGELRAFLENECRGEINAFAGASGVGKSTLMNLLFGGITREIGRVSEKTGRGRHTTRTVELFETGNGGFIADTPGFTMLDFEHFDFFAVDDLVNTFAEFEKYIGKCRYTKCTHTKEEGCAIVEAVKAGDIPLSRHQSYIALREILKNKQPWKKK